MAHDLDFLGRGWRYECRDLCYNSLFILLHLVGVGLLGSRLLLRNVRRRFVKSFFFDLEKSNRMTLGSTNLKLNLIFRIPEQWEFEKGQKVSYDCTCTQNL